MNVEKITECEFGKCKVKATKAVDCLLMTYEILNSDFFPKGLIIQTQARMNNIDDNKIYSTMHVNDFSMVIEGYRLSH